MKLSLVKATTSKHSRQMLPRLTLHDFMDRLPSNPIFQSQCTKTFTRNVTGSNIQNVSIGKRGMMMRRPKGNTKMPLGISIGMVIRHCSKKQMRGIDTGAIVAGVTNTSSVKSLRYRNSPARNHPRDSMSKTHFKVQSNHAITINASGCIPNPTRTKQRNRWMNWTILGNLSPETLRLSSSDIHFEKVYPKKGTLK